MFEKNDKKLHHKLTANHKHILNGAKFSTTFFATLKINDPKKDREKTKTNEETAGNISHCTGVWSMIIFM